jgi:hypothetical protein
MLDSDIDVRSLSYQREKKEALIICFVVLLIVAIFILFL